MNRFRKLTRRMNVVHNASDSTVEILDTAERFAKQSIRRRDAVVTLRAWYESSQLVEAAQAIQPLDEFDPMHAIDIILDNAYNEKFSNGAFAALLVLCTFAGLLAALLMR